MQIDVLQFVLFCSNKQQDFIKVTGSRWVTAVLQGNGPLEINKELRTTNKPIYRGAQTFHAPRTHQPVWLMWSFLIGCRPGSRSRRLLDVHVGHWGETGWFVVLSSLEARGGFWGEWRSKRCGSLLSSSPPQWLRSCSSRRKMRMEEDGELHSASAWHVCIKLIQTTLAAVSTRLRSKTCEVNSCVHEERFQWHWWRHTFHAEQAWSETIMTTII